MPQEDDSEPLCRINIGFHVDWIVANGEKSQKGGLKRTMGGDFGVINEWQRRRANDEFMNRK